MLKFRKLVRNSNLNNSSIIIFSCSWKRLLTSCWLLTFCFTSNLTIGMMSARGIRRYTLRKSVVVYVCVCVWLVRAAWPTVRRVACYGRIAHRPFRSGTFIIIFIDRHNVTLTSRSVMRWGVPAVQNTIIPERHTATRTRSTWPHVVNLSSLVRSPKMGENCCFTIASNRQH